MGRTELSETNIQVYFKIISPKAFTCKNLNYFNFGRMKNIFQMDKIKKVGFEKLQRYPYFYFAT